MIESCGHLALWVGVYAASWMFAAAALLGVERHDLAIAVVSISTISVYLLDRIKLTNASLDPADAVAHPKRRAFLDRHAAASRGLMAMCFIAACIGGFRLHPIVPVFVFLAHAGVWLYGTAPHRPRVKDRLVLKNAAVAVSMSGYVVVMTLVDPLLVAKDLSIASWLDSIDLMRVIGVGSFVLIHIFLDAMLCDIDDAEADEMFGTRTIVNRVGERCVWQLALLGSVVAAGILMLTAAAIDGMSVETSMYLGGSFVVSKAALWMVRQRICPGGRWVRDAVDLHAAVMLPVLFAVEWSGSI